MRFQEREGEIASNKLIFFKKEGFFFNLTKSLVTVTIEVRFIETLKIKIFLKCVVQVIKHHGGDVIAK